MAGLDCRSKHPRVGVDRQHVLQPLDVPHLLDDALRLRAPQSTPRRAFPELLLELGIIKSVPDLNAIDVGGAMAEIVSLKEAVAELVGDGDAVALELSFLAALGLVIALAPKKPGPSRRSG